MASGPENLFAEFVKIIHFFLRAHRFRLGRQVTQFAIFSVCLLITPR